MRTLSRRPLFALLAIAVVSLLAIGSSPTSADAKDEATRGLRYPSLSPDGKFVTFAYRGDIWVAETTGKNPRISRLTIHEAQDTLPRFSPDGKHIAFSSQREGSYDIYVISVDGGIPKRVTHHSAFEIVCDWTNDGKSILFVSNRDAEASGMDAYTVPMTGGTARRLTFDGGTREATFSADGKQLVFVRGTNTIYQDNYTGSGNYDVWTIPVRDAGETAMPIPTRITKTDGNERYPFFAADGKSIYVVGEQKGVANFYRVMLKDGKRTQLTKWKGNDVQRAHPGFDHNTVAFERHGRIDLVDLGAKQPNARALNLVVRSDVRHSGVVQRQIHNGTKMVNLSRDGGRLAFSVHGDIWTMSASGGNARRVTTGIAMDEWPRWSPDGRRIAFQSDKGGNSDIWVMDARGRNVKQVTKSKANDFFHNWSPDGKSLVFCSERSGNRDIWRIEIDTGKTTRLTNHRAADDDPSFSPDGRMIAFDSARDGPQGIYVMDADGSNVRRVTGPGGGMKQVPTFSPDGQFLCYETMGDAPGRSGGLHVIAVSGGPSMQISNNGSTACWSARGDYIYFTAEGAGGEEIYRVPAPKGIENREKVPFHGTIEIDTKSELADLFEEAWRHLQRRFYDPKMHGVDWNAMKKKYKQMAVDAEIKEEFQNVVNQMLAELNASHLGIRGGQRPSNAVPSRSAQTGYLGARLSETPGKSGGRKVLAVTKGGPVDKAGLRVGDEITHLNKKKIGAGTDLDRILAGKAGKPLEVRFRPITEDGLGDERRVADLKPVHGGQLRQMQYGAWIKRNQQMVRKQSKGRLGYVHLSGMNGPNLQKFYAAVNGWNRNKRIQGMVLDVRNNGGGNIHNQLMSVLLAKPYLFVRPRNAPAKIAQPTRYFDKPVVVLCNQRSFSDAEVFPHVFQAAKRGKVVGVPTPGGVIGTQDITLSDGSVFRIPLVGYYAVDGTNLEGTGAIPDIIVEETIEDLRAKRDPQLVKAIRVVMDEAKAARKTAPSTDKPSTTKPPTSPETAPKPDRPNTRQAGAMDPLADVVIGEWVRYSVKLPTMPDPIKLKISITGVADDVVSSEPQVEEGPEIPFPLPRDWENKPIAEALSALGEVSRQGKTTATIDGKDVEAAYADVIYGGATLRLTFTNAIPGLGLYKVEMGEVTFMEAIEWGRDEVETPAESPDAPKAPTANTQAEGLKNPLYDAKVGEWLRRWTFDPKGEKIVSTLRVTAVDDDQITIETSMAGVEGAFDPIRHPRRELLKLRGRGGQRTVSEETIEIAGRKVRCTVIEIKGRRGVTKRWISNDVTVTGRVRTMRNGKVVSEVTDWGVGDASGGTSQEK